jgi:hypothetical protein
MRIAKEATVTFYYDTNADVLSEAVIEYASGGGRFAGFSISAGASFRQAAGEQPETAMGQAPALARPEAIQ